jgi:hypothetical protein
LVLLIGGSAFGIVASLTDLDDETAVAILLLFAVASLATDIVFDFGKGWGPVFRLLPGSDQSAPQAG